MCVHLGDIQELSTVAWTMLMSARMAGQWISEAFPSLSPSTGIRNSCTLSGFLAWLHMVHWSSYQHEKHFTNSLVHKLGFHSYQIKASRMCKSEESVQFCNEWAHVTDASNFLSHTLYSVPSNDISDCMKTATLHGTGLISRNTDIDRNIEWI